MGVQSIKEELLGALRTDNNIKLIALTKKYKINENKVFTKHNRNLIQLSAYLGSIKCFKELVHQNYDINKKETQNNNTLLFIAAKFNFDKIVKYLLNLRNDPEYEGKQSLKILEKNDEGLNEFEVAFLRGNYRVCYLFLYGDNEKILKKEESINIDNIKEEIKEKPLNEAIENSNNSEKKSINDNNAIILKPYTEIYQSLFLNNPDFLEKYETMHSQLNYPLFKMNLFYDCLKKRIIPEKCPSFGLDRMKAKMMYNKVPDPNESWGHFFKRMLKFELYNPPLVDKNSIQPMNSLYMSFQSGLMKSEYGNVTEVNEQTCIDNNVESEENKNLTEPNLSQNSEEEINEIVRGKKNKYDRNRNSNSKFSTTEQQFSAESKEHINDKKYNTEIVLENNININNEEEEEENKTRKNIKGEGNNGNNINNENNNNNRLALKDATIE